MLFLSQVIANNATLQTQDGDAITLVAPNGEKLSVVVRGDSSFHVRLTNQNNSWSKTLE